MKHFDLTSWMQVRLVMTLPSATRMPPAVWPPSSTLVSQRNLPVAQDAVRGGKVDHVLVDAEALVARRTRIDALRIIAGIFPDQIAVGRIDRLNGCARREQIHDA